MAHFTRREFLQTGLAAGTLAVAGVLPLSARRGSATDVVTLGRSGVKVTRLAFGTGSISGKVQRELGQDGFTRLVRHAYDHGIRFFETAESYGEALMHLAGIRRLETDQDLEQRRLPGAIAADEGHPPAGHEPQRDVVEELLGPVRLGQPGHADHGSTLARR